MESDVPHRPGKVYGLKGDFRSHGKKGSNAAKTLM
jgi:8-oxo-dGTP diphosphatase